MGTYLTERQRQILDYLRGYLAEHRVAPTLREIRERFGYSSYGTVQKHLKLLEEKGYLKRHWNQKRGLELTRALAAGEECEIPFFGLIAAGQPLEAVSGADTVSVPPHLLGATRASHFVLKVVGDSMIEEGIHDGDLVIVQQQEEAKSGEMVVALIGSDATLKRFYPEGETVRLQPANARMSALLIPAREVKVQGIVVGLMRRF